MTAPSHNTSRWLLQTLCKSKINSLPLDDLLLTNQPPKPRGAHKHYLDLDEWRGVVESIAPALRMLTAVHLPHPSHYASRRTAGRT